MSPRSISDSRSTSGWPAPPTTPRWRTSAPSSSIASARCRSPRGACSTSSASVGPPPPVAGKPLSPDMPMPGDVRMRPPEHDEGVADRVVAVVNNDAITLSELQETIVAYRAENRQQRGGGPSDDELVKQFLPRLIDSRLQLQEADRERITVDDQEVSDELTERIKIYKTNTIEEFEKMVKEQGITMDSVKKRVREGLRVQKVIRRKVV